MQIIDNLKDKVILITGASRGIGRHLAIAMARHGATLVITSRHLDQSPGQGGTLEGTYAAIEKSGGKVLAIPATIINPEGAKLLIDQTIEKLGRIDVLVNNAGIYPDQKILDTPPGDWNNAVDVNLNSIFYLTHYVLPHMISAGRGRIVNVSSEMALRRRPGRVAYSTTKAAVDVFSQALSEELKAQNIEVNVWTPGHVRTDMSGDKATDNVEVVEESFLWMLAQEHMALTGQILRRPEFGVKWGLD